MHRMHKPQRPKHLSTTEEASHCWFIHVCCEQRYLEMKVQAQRRIIWADNIPQSLRGEDEVLITSIQALFHNACSA